MKNKKKIIIIATLSAVVVVIIAVVGYWQRVPLFKYLPSTLSTECSTSDDNILVLNKTQKPFSGRLRTEFEERTEIYSYKDGVLHGLNVAYHNGKVKEVGYWKNDQQDGHFQLYTTEGVLVDDGYFKNGVRHGPIKQYYEVSGKLRVAANYINGSLDGVCEQYNEQGVLTIQLNYTEGALHGKSLYYYDDGRKKLEANFVDGALDGDAYYWTEDGVEVRGDLDPSGVFTPR